MFWSKKRKQIKNLIAVRPKNYRRIVLYAIEKCKEPNVWMDANHVKDFSEDGPLVQSQIGMCIDFLIRDGSEDVLGFHDHPDQMWVTENYRYIAEHCDNEGWLKIQPNITSG